TFFPVRGPAPAGSPAGSGANDVIQVGAISVDVTREQRARAEANLQKQHLHSLFMRAPVAICIVRGPSLDIELANDHCCALWHKPERELVGRPFVEAMADTGIRDNLELVLASGESRVVKETPMYVDGRVNYFNYTYAPMRDVDGAVNGVLLVATDVTDEIRARIQLERTIEYSDKFTAILGHDLRNPLNAIATSAQLLVRRATTNDIARPALRIVLSAERMGRMIMQLLDLARVRSEGGLRIEP